MVILLPSPLLTVSLGDGQPLLASLPPPRFKTRHCFRELSVKAVGPPPLLVCKADCLQRSYTKNEFGFWGPEDNWWNWVDTGFGSLHLRRVNMFFNVGSDLGFSTLGAKSKFS